MSRDKDFEIKRQILERERGLHVKHWSSIGFEIKRHVFRKQETLSKSRHIPILKSRDIIFEL